MTLTPEDVEAVALRVTELLARPAAFEILTAGELAERLGVSVHYVYEHAGDLGALRLGDGPKARLRFDPEVARRALETRPIGAQPRTRGARFR